MFNSFTKSFTLEELVKARRKAEEIAIKEQRQEVSCVNCKFHEEIENKFLFFKTKTDYCHVYRKKIAEDKNVGFVYARVKAGSCPVYENKYGYKKEDE